MKIIGFVSKGTRYFARQAQYNLLAMTDANPTTEPLSPWPMRLAMLVVAVGGALWFGWKLDEQPFFDDESAYVAYSYYARLLTTPNHEDWLHFAAFDSPPFYKYLIGVSIHAFGRQTPTSIVPAEKWHGGDHSQPKDPMVLRAARVAMLLGAVLGCVAIFLCGVELVGIKTGLIAAFLLAASPLYCTHARRAMADDWTQALVMLTLWSFFRLWKRLSDKPVRGFAAVGWIFASSLFCGLALATKLNALGIVNAIMLTAALFCWYCIFRASAEGPARRKFPIGMAAALSIPLMSFAISVAINPYFYSQPDLGSTASASATKTPMDRVQAKRQQMSEIKQLGIVGRAKFMLDYRMKAQQESITAFPDYALPDVPSRLRAIYFEGLGRWSALGQLPHFAGLLKPADEPVAKQPLKRRGDNLPEVAFQSVRAGLGTFLIALGFLFAWSEGKRQVRRGGLPAAWIFVAWAVNEVVMLTITLTLDWDRYYMGIVCVASLLIAVGVGGTLVRIAERMTLPPQGSETSL